MIEEVIKNVRDSFLNEGVDEQVLQELKQVRERLMRPSKQEKTNLQIFVFLLMLNNDPVNSAMILSSRESSTNVRKPVTRINIDEGKIHLNFAPVPHSVKH